LIGSKETLLDATPELMKKIARESAGIKLTVKKEDIIDCTNPRKLIETYKVQGGPSPIEVERAIKTNNKNIADEQRAIAKLKKNLADAQENLNVTVESYASSLNAKAQDLKI
jgi:hypothetical protein